MSISTSHRSSYQASLLQPLRLELALGGFNRGLPCEDVDGHAMLARTWA